MLKSLQKKTVAVRILLGAVVLFVGGAMVITLVPGTGGTLGDTPGVVATVGRQAITEQAIQQQVNRFTRGQPVPEVMRGFYNRQVFDQMLNQHLLRLEAERLGLRVTDAERAELIKQVLPSVFPGDEFQGLEAYANEVRTRLNMTVAEFEEAIDSDLLQEKFLRLVTDGVSVTPEEVELEFRLQNEKVRLAYVLLRPSELASTVPVPEAELAGYFEKNASRYQVPEKRSIRYVLLDHEEIRRSARPSEGELRAYYQANQSDYQVQERVRLSHILFSTVNKTDAEVEEVRRKAEDVLRQLRGGARFEDLASQHSDDTRSKDSGGDMGWIQRGQLVPEMEQAAFRLSPGSVSDVIRTSYGFEILKVVEREAARTRSFEEVRESIAQIASQEKAEQQIAEEAEKLAAAVRRSTRRPIKEVAAELGLRVQETEPAAVTEPYAELGADPDLQTAVFRLRPGELSSPRVTLRGHVVLTVKDVLPAHQGTLDEVRERVVEDYRQEKAVELARTRAEELSRRARETSLAAAARAMGLEVKSTELFARTETAGELGSARQLGEAFDMPLGQAGPAKAISDGWVVFAVSLRGEPAPGALERQRAAVEQRLLQQKRNAAFQAFLEALKQRMLIEGQLRIHQETFKRLTEPPQSPISG